MSLFYEDNILSISLSYIWSSTIHIQQYNNNMYILGDFNARTASEADVLHFDKYVDDEAFLNLFREIVSPKE